MTTTSVFAVITGGGTGGHVTPALAIADALIASGHGREELRFVGAVRGLEAEAVPAAGYDIDLLTLDGIQRSLRPRDVLRSCRSIGYFVVAVGTCLRMLRRLRPSVVVGVGGYASAPAVIAARLLRLPTMVHEQNAVPGLVNRIAVRCGAKPAVSFLPSPWRDAVVTGNPIRTDVAATTRHEAAPPLLAVVGGSLGAGRLNAVALDLYDRWRHRDDLAVFHIAGPTRLEECAERLRTRRAAGDRLDYGLVGFETDMAGLYGRAAVLLCRAGATTVAEVSTVGVPAVYVPWSGSAEGQQAANAAAACAAGAAVMVADDDCDVHHVGPIVEALLADVAAREAMAAAAREMGRPGAAAALAARIEAVAANG